MANNRTFQEIKTTLAQDTLKTRFDNMLTKVNNMLARDNIYSTWIRLDIGKSNKNRISFNSASNDTNKNLILSLDYEKVISGAANAFTFKIAFDLFNYGQKTKGNVEALDELIYKALNISNYTEATDQFYCKFQYGYNVTGDTQIVSPTYEGLITDIIPSVDYTNGKTYYTIKGTSFVANAGFKYSFAAVDNVNGLDVVARTLWWYMGHPDTKSALSGVSGLDDRTQEDDVTGAKNNGNPVIARFMIDVPEDLRKSASSISLDTMNDMTPIDYISKVLSVTFNTSDPNYVKDDDGEHYNIEEGGFKPYYTYYITDSNGGGVPTIHITYISSQESALNTGNNLRKVNFSFDWFNRTNNIVVGWNPEVNIMSYFLVRSQLDSYTSKIGAKKEEMEVNRKTMQELEDTANEWDNKTTGNSIVDIILKGFWKIGANAMRAKRGSLEKSNADLQAEINELQEKLDAFSQGYEYYKATITLVGIPADIPVSCVLSIKPKIFESISRTQGNYMVLGATDKINTNGLFTTTINLFRLSDWGKGK